MCWCNPSIRTPWCGKKGCEAPTQPQRVTKTFEEYLREEMTARGVIDFTFRALEADGKIYVYVHPLNRDGNTTPNLRVKGNLVIEE